MNINNTSFSLLLIKKYLKIYLVSSILKGSTLLSDRRFGIVESEVLAITTLIMLVLFNSHIIYSEF